MSNRASTSLMVLTAILLLSILSPHVYGSDDSNPSNLTPTNNTTSSSPTTNQILNALDNLTRNPYNQNTPGPNDTQVQQLTKQLESQLRSGNNVGAQQTLQQLKQYTQSSQGQDLSPLLRDLIQSMSVNSNGLSVDTSLLRSLIGQPDINGMPTGLLGMDPSTAASQLASLSSALNGVDPRTALSLLQYSNQIQNSIGIGLLSGGSIGGGLQAPTLPSVGNIPNPLGQTGGSTPTFPNVSTLTPGVPTSFGGFGISVLSIVLIAIAAVAGFLLLYRNRFQGLVKRKFPGMIKKKPLKPEEGLNLASPRDLIVYYFRKMVGAMRKRGVDKLDPDTHREFSEKCAPLPEAPPVKNISVLYEKAVFSGRDVTMPEASEAGGYVSQVESTTTSSEKEQPRKSLITRIRHLC